MQIKTYLNAQTTSMAKHIETGKWGEITAVRYLVKKGFKIRETNWQFSYAEIDIIAEISNNLVFIEVKTRSNDYFGKPEDFVSNKQQTLISDAASQYMVQNNYGGEFRFDIISILIYSKENFKIVHFEDAFFPGL